MTAADTTALIPGQLVFCTVRGDYLGWQTVTAVRPRDGYLRIAGFHAFCPPHNFSLTDPRAPLEPPPSNCQVYGSRHASED